MWKRVEKLGANKWDDIPLITVQITKRRIGRCVHCEEIIERGEKIVIFTVNNGLSIAHKDRDHYHYRCAKQIAMIIPGEEEKD